MKDFLLWIVAVFKSLQLKINNIEKKKILASKCSLLDHAF